jgi:hypothetical protein
MAIGLARIDDAARARAATLVLVRSEMAIGLPLDNEQMPVKERCERVLRAAQGGGLDAQGYRVAWLLREVA